MREVLLSSEVWGRKSGIYLHEFKNFFQVCSPNNFCHFNNAQHRQNQATKVKAHGTWCLPVPLPGEEVRCTCHLRGQGPDAVALGCSCLFSVLSMLVYKFKVHLCKCYLKKLPCSVSRVPGDEQKPQQTLSAGVSLFFCWLNLRFQLSWLS